MNVPQIVDEVLAMVEKAGLQNPISLQDSKDVRELLISTLFESGHVDVTVEVYHRHVDLIVEVWYGPQRTSVKRIIKPR